MMKRKFLAVVLPIVGCATLVGSGFSAWYFSDAVIGDDGNNGIAVDITDPIQGDQGLTIGLNSGSDVRGGTKLVLDQGGADINAGNYKDRGIFFTNDATATDAVEQPKFDLKIDAIYDNDELNLARLRVNELKLEIRIDIKVSNYLLNFVTVNEQAQFSVTRGVEGLEKGEKSDKPTPTTDDVYTTYSYVYYPSLEDYSTESKDTWTLSLDVSTKEDEENGGLVNSYLTYKETTTDDSGYLTGGKPTTTAEYNAMVHAINANKPAGEHFEVHYSFNLVADLSAGA